MTKENLRPVEVKLSGKIFKGVFHGWTTERYEDEEGKENYHMLAVVENSENGEVTEVDPDKIRFLDR